jgi:hypothetical protein
VPAEQRKLLQAMADLESQALLRGAVGLSPAQFDEVKAIRKGGSTELPPDDKARFKDLWTQYDAAKNDAEKQKGIEKKLLKGVNDLESKLKPLVLQSAAERAAKAQALLTPEQWQKFEQGKKRE